MNKENLLNNAIKNKKPIIVNYGKWFLKDGDFREPAYWDDNLKTYISETGIWSLNLLHEIARGEVENTTIEEFK